MLGFGTTVLVGLGVAIGSGILRTPPLVAQQLGTGWAVLLAWALGGLAIFVSSLVMAELATRFPRSGGEYAWLREAYGPFVAFFFGWAYTIFMVGGGAATIAAAFGDAAHGLFGGLPAKGWAGLAVVTVVGANMAGLKTGAALQNVLTVFKVLIVLGIVGAGVLLTDSPPPVDSSAPGLPSAWIAAVLPVIWAYAGSTDAVKLGGEIENPQRAIPRALFAGAAALTLIYVLVNAGLLAVLGVDGLAASTLPMNVVAERAFGPTGRGLVAAGSAIVFLGGLSSTVLATVRVAWALGQDGHGFGVLGKMSARQAPVGALAVVGFIALGFAVWKDFESILGIYFLAGSILFGLVYASLLVFRRRDRTSGTKPEGIFRCPAPTVLVGLMLLLQGGMAVGVVMNSPWDAVATFGLLGVVALAWRVSGGRRQAASR